MTIEYQLSDNFERTGQPIYEKVVFRAMRAVQTAEWNEAQEIHRRRQRRITDSLFAEGNVIRGADVVIDPDTGATQVTGGAVYVQGDVRGVPEAAMTIPVLGAVEIGVRLTEALVTELEDPSLLNQVPGSETFHAPGAARLRYDLAWGWRTDGSSDGGAGDFYAVYTVTNGVLDNKTPPPALDGVNMALARYARAQTGGTHVVKGLGVTALSVGEGLQVYSLAAGSALVDGWEVTKPTATRLAFPDDPDPLTIESEPHPFLPAGGVMRLDVVYAPLASIVEVKITAQRNDVAIVHGAYSGAADALPDVSVLQIINVKQGGTTYVAGTDYTLVGNTVNWSPAGAEPAPGSTYTVTYQHFTDATITDIDDTGFTVAGAVSGSNVMVDYSTKLPRHDRLVMGRDGVVSRVRGIADLRSPSVPSVPAGGLLLATLHQTWFGPPGVVIDADTLVPVAEVQDMKTHIRALFQLVAAERLRNDVTAREPAGNKGVFVDALMDDDMRDAGVAQNAAIVQGELMLPIVPVFPDTMMADGSASMLGYTLEVVVAQELASGKIRINPYDSFSPIPCKVSVITPIDRWTIDQEVWDTDSLRFIRNGHFVPGVSRVTDSKVISESIETVARTVTAAQFLRQIPLLVRVEHLGPGEIVPSITFDGAVVGQNLTANAAGVVEHGFTIPAGTPAGAKRIEVAAAATGTGVATFIGEGQVVTTERRRIATVEEYHVDPVAQGIILTRGRHVGGIELLFRAKGTSQVVVQMRTMVNGYPGRDILAEARLNPADIRVDGQPTRFTWDPVWMAADEEFCVAILCDDADAEVATASLGEFDAAKQRWVTEQPYRVGVMFSSSNGTTWTAHQATDLWFRLLGCRFTATSRTVPLATLAASQVSDLVGLFSAERPDAETRVALRLIAADGRVIDLSDGQPLNLTSRITGNVSVQLVLEGSDIRSPVVYPGIEAIFGVQTDIATYVGRQFATPSASTIGVVIDAILPGTSTVTVEVQNAASQWVTVPLTSGLPLGDGWEERTHDLAGYGAAQTRVRLTLTGSVLNRPRIRRIRVIAA